MNYLIEYVCFSKSGKILDEGKVKAKGAKDAIHAQIRFEQYLKNKYASFGRLEVKSIENNHDIMDFLKGFGL